MWFFHTFKPPNVKLQVPFSTLGNLLSFKLNYYIKYFLGVFDIEQSRRILLAGKQIGLELNFHGDELNYTGSAEVNYLLFFFCFLFLIIDWCRNWCTSY